MKKTVALFVFILLYNAGLFAQKTYLLLPDRVFDGVQIHEGWGVLVKDSLIISVGSVAQLPKENAEVITMKGCTLLPGLIEGHSHLYLHPYNETSWNDQVLKESRSYRTARAVVHAKRTLENGFTTVRDLGTEGAMYDDAGLKKSIDDGIIPGPRMLVATRAIVATGSYGVNKGYSADEDFPKGAEEADGHDAIIKAVRTQIGKGADVIKIYADYRWGVNGENQPTFSQEEIALIVETAKSSGRPVAAHAGSPEAIRRAVLGGCETIEHADNCTAEVFQLMKEKGVYYCPTLAATEAIAKYRGWIKGKDADPESVKNKKQSFKTAMEVGVKIIFGGDVGVFPHGDNAREMELMVEYGMKPIDVLRSATSVNTTAFHLNNLGQIKTGMLADIIIVEGKPDEQIQSIRKIKLVMKNGKIVVRN